MSKVSSKTTVSNGSQSSLVDSIPRNSKGGIFISDEDMKAAFDFFDAKGTGKISCVDLRERMQSFTKKMTKKEIKTFFGSKEFITLQEIKDIVKDNELSIDPYTEAFSILDPTSEGFIPEERLKKIFMNLGFGDLNEEELQLLISTGDADEGE